MPSVQDIIEYLSSIDELEAKWLGDPAEIGQEIAGFNIDRDAGPGEMAWISPKQVAVRPGGIKTFQGSLLIAPFEVQAHKKPVLCTWKPKLAVILAIRQFFNHLSNITWPVAPERIAADARIGQSVSLAPGVVIGPGVVIEDNVRIGPNTVIAFCHIKNNVQIGANNTIGLPGFGFDADENSRNWRFPHVGGVVIETECEIGSNTCIDRGSIGNTIIGEGVKIDNLVHIAHNVVIGANSLIIANSMIAGSAVLEKQVWVSPSVSVMNQAHIGESAVLGMGTVVLKDVEPNAVMVGNPAKLLRKQVPNE